MYYILNIVALITIKILGVIIYLVAFILFFITTLYFVLLVIVRYLWYYCGILI